MSTVEPAEPYGRTPSWMSVRTSDQERDEAADRLRTAAQEGQLDPDELVERLDHVYAAKTYGDLESVLADLTSELVISTTSANVNQRGRWHVPRRLVVRCTSAQVKIDFTEAVSLHRKVTIEATCGTGWITLVVPQGWAVRVDASSTNSQHVVNGAASVRATGAPTLTGVAGPRLGYRIKQLRESQAAIRCLNCGPRKYGTVSPRSAPSSSGVVASIKLTISSDSSGLFGLGHRARLRARKSLDPIRRVPEPPSAQAARLDHRSVAGVERADEQVEGKISWEPQSPSGG